MKTFVIIIENKRVNNEFAGSGIVSRSDMIIFGYVDTHKKVIRKDRLCRKPCQISMEILDCILARHKSTIALSNDKHISKSHRLTLLLVDGLQLSMREQGLSTKYINRRLERKSDVMYCDKVRLYHTRFYAQNTLCLSWQHIPISINCFI